MRTCLKECDDFNSPTISPNVMMVCIELKLALTFIYFPLVFALGTFMSSMHIITLTPFVFISQIVFISQ